ncbi:MAG: tripartite tricarboxylate transporter permease [Alphaproteobacteria bacterium]
MAVYFEAFYHGLIAILPFSAHGQQAFLFMLVGIFIGFWVGILPGIGGAATLALMLPFVYDMDPTQAFAFLLGMASVTATAGDITSILFGVPGEGTTAAVIVDGHPMSKKGEAGRALSASLVSSLIGAIFGALVLALAIPIVRPIVLSIGSAEFFMLAILGIVFIVSLSGRNLLKGLISGALGLALATVGLDPINSVPRYTLERLFGEDVSLFLWDGISLVVVTIGLFAIPEIIDLGVQGSSIARERIGKLGGVMDGVKDVFRHWWLVMRCSVIGSYIGALPGLGGSVAQWLAYAHAVQSSPDQSRFGQGAVEGVIGPCAATNAKEGGALIPTVAFGVPGSVSMAILLGAFIMQGIVPGPDMLNPAKYLPLTFSLLWVVVVSNIITVAASFLFLKQLANITHVKGTYLIPFVLLLIYIGGFAVKNSFGDLFLVFLFGVIGWFMVQFDWPRPPMVLGLVLGDIAESNFFIATSTYGYKWLTHIGVIIIFLLMIGVLAYSIIQARRHREGKRGPSDVELQVVVRSPVYRSLFALSLVLVFGYALFEAYFGYGVDFPSAALFPRLVSIPGLALSLIVLAMELGHVKRPTGAEEKTPELKLDQFRTWTMMGWLTGFFLAIWLLGFIDAAPVMTFLYLKINAREKWTVSIVLAVLSWAFFYGLFNWAIQLPFPAGALFDWFKGKPF